MSLLRDAIRAASDERDKPTSIDTSIPESQKAIKPEIDNASMPKDEQVNLAIKVSRRQRVHWLIEAKKQRTSLTAVIIEALNARFGEAGDE